MPSEPRDPKLEEIANLKDPRAMMAALKGHIADLSRNFEPVDLAGSVKYLVATAKILREDHERCYKGFEEAGWRTVNSKKDGGALDDTAFKDMQFWFRLSVRTFLSEVEGTAFAMRQVVIWAHRRGEIALSAGEQALLREESYRFDARKKEVEISPGNFLRTGDAIIFSLTFLARLVNPDFVPATGDNGWQSLKDLIEVRNQLTHPKELIQLYQDPEKFLETFPRARRWWYNSVVGVLAKVASP